MCYCNLAFRDCEAEQKEIIVHCTGKPVGVARTRIDNSTSLVVPLSPRDLGVRDMVQQRGESILLERPAQEHAAPGRIAAVWLKGPTPESPAAKHGGNGVDQDKR